MGESKKIYKCLNCGKDTDRTTKVCVECTVRLLSALSRSTKKMRMEFKNLLDIDS